MNKERIAAELNLAKEKTIGVEIIAPGALSPEQTADNLVTLLRTMHVEHGVTKNVDKLISDIEVGDVKTWFAKVGDEIVATTSLVKSGDAWEGGRSVSNQRGKGMGKLLMLNRALFHLDNHNDSALIGEVRVADNFRGIPSGEATQHIWFGISDIVPHALAPLFGHGEPRRNETFALVASNITSRRPIREQVAHVIADRNILGKSSKLIVNDNLPFTLITPHGNGNDAANIIERAATNEKVSLFAIEATDDNMPLIGSLMANRNILLCGLDRKNGINNKPIILFTTFSPSLMIAPSRISNDIEPRLKNDMQNIADRFTNRGNK